MPTNTNERPFERVSFGGMQRKTTKFTKDPTEVYLVVNGSYGRIGGIEKVLGMSKVGHALTETTTSTSTSTSTSSSSSSSSSSSTSTSTSTSSSTSTSTSTSSTTTMA